MKHIFSVVLIVGLAAICAFGYWQWIKSPTYSLKQLGAAIESHDRERAEKYIDIENVATILVDRLLETSGQAQAKPKNQWEEAGQNMAMGFIQMMKPAMANAAKAKFLEYVEKGSFEESGSSRATPSLAITASFQKVVDKKRRFKEVKSVEKDGKIALVTIELTGADGQSILPRLKMRERDGYWQVIEIVNFAELMNQKPPESKN